MDNRQLEQAKNELRTLLDVVRWGASQFTHANLYFGHGTDNAWDEAMDLALHVLALSHSQDPRILHARLTTDERQSILNLYQQRIVRRVPAAYLTHHARFAGLSFYVDSRTLVPRSPIAELIEAHFEPWIEVDDVHDILDLCTGSGCIAIACAAYFPEARVDAVDISQDALTVAKRNIANHGMQEQVSAIESNLFSALDDKKYDVIVSNPPYVSLDEWQQLPSEYHSEPSLGLVAQEEGIALVREILLQASTHLTNHGILIVEVGNSMDYLIEQFPQVPFTWLEFERGGDGVFLLTAAQCNEFAADFARMTR